MGINLVTLEKWETLPPKSQGYLLYMQACLPGSELKGLKNPYAQGTEAHDSFKRGEHLAVLEVTDGEE